MRHAPILALTLGVLLLAGCRSTPPPRDTTAVDGIATDWAAPGRGQAGAEVTDRWWEVFGDAGLNAAVDEALAQNHDIRAAASRIEVAMAEARVAGAALSPKLDATASGSRRRTNADTGSGDTIAIYTDSVGISLDLSWELDLWGRIRADESAATARWQASQADYAGARLSIAGQTVKAWLALAEAEEQFALAQHTLESFTATARRAGDRVDAGVQSPGDKHLTQANVASARGLVEQRREALLRSRRQLEVLLGRYPAGVIKAGHGLPVTIAPVTPGLPADVIRRRPDLVAAERRLSAATEGVTSAKAALYPRISLSSSMGTSSDQLQDLLSGKYLIWNIAGNLVQPIMDGGRLRAQVAANEGRAGEAVEIFAQQALVAFSEVENAMSTEAILLAREAAQADAMRLSSAAIQVSENRYLQGVETVIAVLESQRRSLDAQSALLSVRRQRLTTRVDLYLALGGGVDAYLPDLSATPATP